MKRSLTEKERDLSKASEILLACSEKAFVLKVCNDYAAQEGGFPELEKGDIGVVYRGMSSISHEIAEHVSDILDLMQDVENSIGDTCKPLNEVSA